MHRRDPSTVHPDSSLIPFSSSARPCAVTVQSVRPLYRHAPPVPSQVVILAERSKEEMEKDIELQFSHEDLLGTEIVCRSGSPLLLHDLHKVRARRV